MRSNFFRLGVIIFWVALFFTILKGLHHLPSFKEEKQVLHVFSWPEILAPEIIDRFEKETGITVVRHYYTSNEELLVKLKATKGKGYDLIIPTDYAVKKLIEEDLLEPIDQTQLTFMEHLNPQLLGLPFDPDNTYSIPFIWEVLGFGIDKEHYQKTPFNPTWDEIFHPTHSKAKISMINDPVEAIDVTAHHLFGPKQTLTPQDIALLHTTLINQKPHIEAYAGVRGDYLLITKNCTVAVIPSSYIFRAAKNYPHIDFIVPEKYTFISIENICIPQEAKNTENAYTFLNFLYQPEVFAKESNTFYNFPATTNVRPYIEAPPAYLETLDILNRYDGDFYFNRQILSDKESRSLWVKLKSS